MCKWEFIHFCNLLFSVCDMKNLDINQNRRQEENEDDDQATPLILSPEDLATPIVETKAGGQMGQELMQTRLLSGADEDATPTVEQLPFVRQMVSGFVSLK